MKIRENGNLCKKGVKPIKFSFRPYKGLQGRFSTAPAGLKCVFTAIIRLVFKKIGLPEASRAENAIKRFFIRYTDTISQLCKKNEAL